MRHGAYSVHVRKRYSDARTTEGRRLRATLEALRAEFGPLSVAQAVILSGLKEKLVSAACFGMYLDRQLSHVTDEGEPLAAARYAHGLSESIRKDIELLRDLATRRPKPSFADLLKQEATVDNS